ncbi:hypothetical protein GCM10022252_75610 [Streptosporangium oxazolinicum]|uniref:Uncharacterized protein n=1 Tax=Streptosporangium oxazolinicum TaxID=909287 RepID=A0ABP8BKX0_9ACTN
MATLLVITWAGGRTLRCDARCYTARKDTPCDCVCDRANHGAGLEAALILTRKQVQAWIAAARRREEVTDVEIGLEVQNIPLFDLA